MLLISDCVFRMARASEPAHVVWLPHPHNRGAKAYMTATYDARGPVLASFADPDLAARYANRNGRNRYTFGPMVDHMSLEDATTLAHDFLRMDLVLVYSDGGRSGSSNQDHGPWEVHYGLRNGDAWTLPKKKRR